MKTYQMQQFGWEGIRATDWPQPQPGPGEVLVRIKAISLNYLDWLVIRGDFNANLPLPHTPLSDGAGIVEAVGLGVTAFQPGDAVVTTFIRPWLHGDPDADQLAYPKRAGLGVAGVASEYVVLSENELVKKPANLTLEEASTLTIAGLTAWNGLRYCQLEAGQTVLLYGTGGVSLFALAFAKAQGLRVLLVGRGTEKLARVQELGAAQTYDYQAQSDWPEQLLTYTHGRGVDAVLDSVGGNNLQKSLEAVRVRGRIAVIGWTQGIEATLSTARLMHKQVSLLGMEVGSRFDFIQMNRAIEVNHIRPVIDRVFSITQIREALSYMASGAHVGKIVLTL